LNSSLTTSQGLQLCKEINHGTKYQKYELKEKKFAVSDKGAWSWLLVWLHEEK
jgi:hypothetical protein